MALGNGRLEGAVGAGREAWAEWRAQGEQAGMAGAQGLGGGDQQGQGRIQVLGRGAGEDREVSTEQGVEILEQERIRLVEWEEKLMNKENELNELAKSLELINENKQKKNGKK